MLVTCDYSPDAGEPLSKSRACNFGGVLGCQGRVMEHQQLGPLNNWGEIEICVHFSASSGLRALGLGVIRRDDLIVDSARA